MKELKQKLIFKSFLSVKEIEKYLLKGNVSRDITAYLLEIGNVKMEAVIYKVNSSVSIGYDVFVKETPDSDFWICYDHLPDEVAWENDNIENHMLFILNEFVKKNGLSYTECNFEILKGKAFSKKVSE